MKIWPDDFINKIICGDCIDVMRGMDAESVDMCMTSPPYWGLRDYGADGQYGLEKTPEEYIEHMTQVFHEVKRALKKEGVLFLNMGDTYGGGQAHSDWNVREDYPEEKKTGGFHSKLSKETWKSDLKKPMPKCLMMIPERLAWSLIEDGWILRNKIIWYKPNGMPSSVKDRFSNKWEYLFLFSKNKKYYFDLDAVREPHLESSVERFESSPFTGGQSEMYRKEKEKFSKVGGWITKGIYLNPDGKNPGDVFTIPTQPFPEAHFAVFPEKLCEKPIKAGCPEQVCKKCGKARERIVERGQLIEQRVNPGKPSHITPQGYLRNGKSRCGINEFIKELGWTSCDCNAGFEGGTVLDPFCGAGTTCYVAKEMGRRYIGIDISPEYVKLAEKRLAQGVL